MKIAGIEITHPDRLIYPDEKIIKLDKVLCYDAVAEKMLPLTLHLYLNGRQ